MAKAEDRQLAECKEIRDFTDSKGEIRQSGVFDLEGVEFEIPFTKYFKAIKGKFYYPVVHIAQKAEVSRRTNTAYIRKFCAVSWSEVK